MRILNYNSRSIKNSIVKEQYNPLKYNNKNLSSDVFQKSQVSFGDSSLGDDESQFYENMRNEGILEGYFRIFSLKQYQNLIKNFKDERIDSFHNLFKNIEFVNIDFITNLFVQSGIKTVFLLDVFLKNFNRNKQNKKIFDFQMIEAVKIYGYLKDKNDLNNYGEMLLYLYNQEEASPNPDYSKLNSTVSFLKKIGLKSFKDFEQKFEHLKDKFNNFASIGDKIDAIDYLIKTYEDKKQLIDNIIKEKGINKKAELIYADINNIVDYLYEKNNGENLSPLEDIIDTVSQKNKLKKTAYILAERLFGNFSETDNEINFYTILKECSMSIVDFNDIAKNSIINDNDILDNIIFYKPISTEIAEDENIDLKKSQEIYRKFSDLFNVVYNPDEGINDIKELLDVIKRFNINNSDSMLDFYNLATGKKVKNINSKEFIEFIKLFKYSDSNNLVKTARTQKKTVVELLQAEKSAFEQVEDLINNFIINNEIVYFAGKDALDIYKEYKDSINKNPQNTTQILQGIVSLKANNSNEYQHRIDEVNKFLKFFGDNQELTLFLIKNKINFEDEDESCTYRNQCLNILQLIVENNDEKKAQEIIDYISQSGFLGNSKAFLSNLLDSRKLKSEKNEILQIAAERNIVSLPSLVKLIRNYKSEDGKYDKIIKHLKSQPQEVDFTTYKKILSEIQSKIDSYNIPLKINNDNISNIDIKGYLSCISNKEFYQMLNKIFSASERQNFIAKIPGIMCEQSQQHYSKFRIASEIVSKIDKTDESYSNIASLLKIDRESLGLSKDCSDMIYIKKIETILPKKFIDFINSNDWLLYENKSSIMPNLSLHARMRIIDRFALAGVKDMNELYTQETQEKLHNLFKSIFCDLPSSIKSSNYGNVIAANFNYNSNTIEAVFSQDGTMVTIFPKGSKLA